MNPTLRAHLPHIGGGFLVLAALVVGGVLLLRAGGLQGLLSSGNQSTTTSNPQPLASPASGTLAARGPMATPSPFRMLQSSQPAPVSLPGGD